MAERALATAFVNIVPGTKDLELWMKKGLPNAAEEAGQTSSKTLGSGLLGGLKSVLGPLALAFSAVGIAHFVGDMVSSAEQGAKVDATLANITKSMDLFGGATSTVVGRLQDFATEQMKMTGIDDDVIKGAQAKLMTFSAVGKSANEMGGTFDQATKLAMDLSAAGFGSVDSASVMLGKALQNPIQGVTALQRVGVSLSEAQKEQVKQFMDVNDVAGAQKVILGEVARQVGGTAAASATPMAKMKAQWDDMTQSIGTYLLPVIDNLSSFVVTNVLPMLQGMGDGIKWMMDNANLSVPILATLGGILIAAVAPAIWAAVEATWAFTAALLGNPVTWIVIGIGLLIGAIVLLAMNWDSVVKWIGEAWANISKFFADGFNAVMKWWNDLWTGVWDFIVIVWNGIIKWFSDALAWLVQMFLDWTIYGIIIKNWSAISKFFSDVWDGIIQFFTDAGKNIWDGIVATFTNVHNFVHGIFVSLLAVVKAPINGLIGLINGVIDGLNAINITIPDWVPLVGGNKFGFHLSHIPALAAGGLVTKPTTALIGEAGPEVVTPLKDFERMMGLNNGANQTVIYNAAPNQSIDSEAALLQALKRAKVVAAW